MTTRSLDDLLRRAKGWPEDAQTELAQLAAEIEREGAYYKIVLHQDAAKNKLPTGYLPQRSGLLGWY